MYQVVDTCCYGTLLQYYCFPLAESEEFISASISEMESSGETLLRGDSSVDCF